MVSEAFKAGYRHIDTARMYDTEKATGLAFRDSGLAREDVFITTKLKLVFLIWMEVGLNKGLPRLFLANKDILTSRRGLRSL